MVSIKSAEHSQRGATRSVFCRGNGLIQLDSMMFAMHCAIIAPNCVRFAEQLLPVAMDFKMPIKPAMLDMRKALFWKMLTHLQHPFLRFGPAATLSKPSVGSYDLHYCCICYCVFKHGARTARIVSQVSLL